MGNIDETTTTTPDAPDRVRTYRLRGLDGRDAGRAQLCRAHVREWSEHYRRGRTMHELDDLGREQAGVCELCAVVREEQQACERFAIATLEHLARVEGAHPSRAVREAFRRAREPLERACVAIADGQAPRGRELLDLAHKAKEALAAWSEVPA